MAGPGWRGSAGPGPVSCSPGDGAGLLLDISKTGSGSWPQLGLGCSAGHGTLSPAWGPLTQSSGAVKF